ncbi:MAG: hypothetical protein CMI01_11630 [Oceanospirillaceae bacterium]|nr:hypothetical protein [Oceanospirillaceae bacterium]
MKLFVENLTHVDFSFIHPKRGLLGESWAVNLMLDGTLDAQGMICDFGLVKKRVKQWLDTYLDHCLVVARSTPGLTLMEESDRTRVNWVYPQGGELTCDSPAQAIALLDVEAIEPGPVANWCREQLLGLFPEQVQGLTLEFVPEPIEGAFYHYSHGLQAHEGNCQRIAHGHRSRIQILRNGARDERLEALWAERFRDIYIGTRAHRQEARDFHHYAYNAPQGAFKLSLPARCCYDIETESTVEQIAAHIAQQLKAEFPDEVFEVRAFEGIGKGAVA